MARAFPILVASAALLAVSASAQDIPETPDFEDFLTEDELRAAFTGAELGGCYPDGEPVEERTAADGSLHDLMRTGAPRVGDWWVEDRQICYRYDGSHGHPQGVYCWNIVREGDELHFFNSIDGGYGGSTHCADLVS